MINAIWEFWRRAMNIIAFVELGGSYFFAIDIVVAIKGGAIECDAENIRWAAWPVYFGDDIFWQGMIMIFAKWGGVAGTVI